MENGVLKMAIFAKIIFLLICLILGEYIIVESSFKFLYQWSKPKQAVIKSATNRELSVALIKRVYYNRVPKCGSSTLYQLMQMLSKVNGFTHFNSKIYNERMLNKHEQKRLVAEVMISPTPASFDRHIFFINFTEFNVNNPPSFINLIRDPTDRIISSFFYRREVAKRKIENKSLTTKPSEFWMKKKFEECVTKSDPECTFISGSEQPTLLVPYFCGHHKRCTVLNDEWALHTAKKNIRKAYTVVGVLEYFELSLVVFEAKLNSFFKGVRTLYKQLGAFHANSNPKKPRVSKAVKQILKNNLTAEYELYDFVLGKLFRDFAEYNKTFIEN
ncbi:uronyl 2-sulfotransferase-like isoform X1 [Dinothrombium tinctorium]|uniref:Uronyl 2-sulfotransferase-like isoform X1 n=1 Tax=Dinothrombium tinctorium TaxID=1965070 RepID=A0A443QHB9_9ACAR|nr:uronyl 2-sulfotransferase-like isoform X1 [Dinothrombium tinctorium]